jgi:hypothetical protein
MFGSLPKRSSTLKGLLLSTVALGLASPALAAEGPDLEQKLERLLEEVEALKRSQQEQREQLEKQQREIEAREQLLEEQRKLVDKQIEAQNERIEQREKMVAAPAQAVTVGEEPGSLKIPGTNTSIKIGGYTKADFFYDVNADTGDSFAASAIPPDDVDAKEGQFRAHARQTRVNLTTWTPIEPLGEVRTFIEGDFFGAGGNEVFSNSTSFRIRHAYAEFTRDSFSGLFGQTWTNFMPLASYPETVDFFGPAGIPFARQGQARFTYTPLENLAVSFSAENSELSAREGTITSGTIIDSSGASGLQFGIDKIPDFTAAVEYLDEERGWDFKVSGVARLLGTETGGGAPQDEEKFAWGVLVGGVVPLGELVPIFGEDAIAANFAYGNGIGRYILNGFGEDAVVDDDGDLNVIETWGVAAGYTHFWTDTFRSNLVYGHYEVGDTVGDDDTERLQTLHANLIWSPSDRVNIGLEWIGGLRTFQDSSLDNTAQRVQVGVQVFF